MAEYLAHPQTGRTTRDCARRRCTAPGKLGLDAGRRPVRARRAPGGGRRRSTPPAGDGRRAWRGCMATTSASRWSCSPTRPRRWRPTSAALDPLHGAAADAVGAGAVENHCAQALVLTGEARSGPPKDGRGARGIRGAGRSVGRRGVVLRRGRLEESLGHDLLAAAAFETASNMGGMGDRFGLAWATLRHSYVRLRSGDLERARELLAVSLIAARDLGHTTFVLWALAGLRRGCRLERARSGGAAAVVPRGAGARRATRCSWWRHERGRTG